MAKFLSINGFKIHIEIPTFLIFFSMFLSGTVYQNLVIYRTCYMICGYNKSDCAFLGSDNKQHNTQQLEELVQPHSTFLIIAPTFIQSVLSGFLCLFSGSWSDNFGRTPVLKSSIAGITLGQACMTFLIYLDNISPYYLLLPPFLTALTGGSYCFVTAAISYINDVTSEADRGFRMGLYQIITSATMFLGNFVASYIFDAFGYAVVFGLSTTLCCFALFFVILFVPESIKNQDMHKPFRNIFKFYHLHDIYKVTVKKRDDNGRIKLVLCLIIFSIHYVVLEGNTGVQFLFLRDKFQWSLKDFTLFTSVNTVVGLFGCFIGVYFLHKYLRITESILILTGYISLANSCLMLGLATKQWHIYFSAAVAGYSSIILPMMYSSVSKIVPAEEAGKIYSVINVITAAFVGTLGLPFFTTIYNLTLRIDPGTINFVGAALLALNILLTGIILSLQGLKSQYAYSQLVDSSHLENNLID